MKLILDTAQKEDILQVQEREWRVERKRKAVHYIIVGTTNSVCHNAYASLFTDIKEDVTCKECLRFWGRD